MKEPYFENDGVMMFHGDCIEVMKTFPDSSIDSIVTDPPYGLGFMGKEWDALPPGLLWAQECLRVLKPGGYLLAFGGSRTWHRLACAVEDAGFEMRDSIAWLYGSGFPKSLDVSKAIDKAAGHWRGKAGEVESGSGSMTGANYERTPKGDPVTAVAAAAAGWGTALKPAFEPIVMGRKPLIGTVAANVLAYGTGALNIDGCRVGSREDKPQSRPASKAIYTEGRWPTNVVLSHAEECTDKCVEGCPVAELDSQNDGSSRFFPVFKYQAKAPKKERPVVNGVAHPTVKPLELMKWLIRLVTPPGGIALSPFAGSGTCGEAAIEEGFMSILIEREEDYLPLIMERLNRAKRKE